jgi:hypothetical protein
LEEEKATLEGMIESHDELLMEIARETGLDRMGEDAEDEEEDEDADDGGDVATPPVPAPPIAVPEEIEYECPEEMVSEQEAPVAHEVILADAEPEMPQPCLYHAIMKIYEESLPRMMDDFDYRDDDPNEAALTWMNGFPKMGLMIEIESSSLCLRSRFENTPLQLV